MGNVILILAVVGPLLLGMACVMLWLWWIKRDRRRSPLTTKLLNLPGESLRRRISDLSDNYWEAASLLLVVGPVVLAGWLMIRISRVVTDWSAIKLGLGDAIVGVVGLILFALSVLKAVKTLSKLRQARQGLLGELAVAQGLGPLAQEGAFTFHDFPAEGFNIDHIVVGRSAVFAVETKSRRKPADKGRDSARVAYDGKSLRFPEHVETKPLEQARRQAEWLQRFLGSGVGEPVRVLPLLALPGWFVENLSPRSDVLVSNCKNASFMMSDKFGPALTDAMRKRIAHVLSERYPALDP